MWPDLQKMARFRICQNWSQNAVPYNPICKQKLLDATSGWLTTIYQKVVFGIKVCE